MKVDLAKFKNSKFRSKFDLDANDIQIIEKFGLEKIKQHAEDIILKKLAPAEPRNDGKQTPFKGHPVFKAQHATATCCRGCLQKWHKIEKNKPLLAQDIDLVVAYILAWIQQKYEGRPNSLSQVSPKETKPEQLSLFE